MSESDETNNGKTSPSEDSNNNRSEQNEDSIDVADSDMSDLLVLHPDDNLHESDQLLVNEVDNTPSDDSKPSNNDMLVPQSTSSKVCSEDEDSKEETLKEALRQDVENQIRENVDNKDCDTKEIHSPLKNGKTKSHSHNGGDYGKVNEGPENKSSGKKKSSDHHARSRCRARSRERSLGSRRLKSDVIPDERHHRTGSKKSENVKSKITDNNDRDCVKRNDIKSENGLTESSLKDKMKSSKRYDEMSKNCRRDSPSRCISKSRKSSSKLQSTLNSADRCSRYSDLRNKLIASHKKLNDNSSDDGKDKKERKRLRDKHRSRSGSPVLKSVLTVVNLPESDFRVGGKPRSIKSIAAPLVAVQTPENAVPETSSKAVASDLSRSPKTRKVLILGEERSSSDSEGRSHRRPQINVTLTDGMEPFY